MMVCSPSGAGGACGGQCKLPLLDKQGKPPVHVRYIVHWMLFLTCDALVLPLACGL